MSYRGKSRRKPYFSSNLNAKKNKDMFLQTGMKGFICTCNGQEKQCIREAYNILNEYGDQLCGEENATKPKPSVTVSDHGDSEREKDEVEDELDEFKKEVDALKSQNKQSNRRFQAVDAGIANCVFIKTNIDDPVCLADTIMRDLADKKQLKARFLLRMIPIEITCKAFTDDILNAAAPLIDKYFRTNPLTYAIVISKRCNSSVNRDSLIEKLATLVQERNAEHKVNLSAPTVSIIVEAMKGICGLTVIRDYVQLGKYNLRQICGLPLNDQEGAAVSAAPVPEETSVDPVETKEE